MIRVMLDLELVSKNGNTVITCLKATRLISSTMLVINEFDIELREQSITNILINFNSWLSTLGKKENIQILGDWNSLDNVVLLDAYEVNQITPHFGFIWQPFKLII
ncbi:hypothetical protein [Aliivibrio fischeri]|uniref:hypothetical protein n=2 Tax=Aliivibrio fischeri TaxID=668 RepID=UPI00080E24D4|nr:hypothetical protein [Aliivibrio fischeri]